MPITYFKIASVTVGSGGAANIEFTSIPATFTDLVVLASVRGDASGVNLNTNLRMQFNNSTTDYSQKELFGTGTSTGSATLSYISLGYVSSNNATASSFGNGQAYIPNYTSANNKSVSSEGVAEGNAAGMFMALDAGLWSDTSAITSIKLFVPDFNILQHSTATLYGIKKD
jgi:hypothetical protein